MHTGVEETLARIDGAVAQAQERAVEARAYQAELGALRIAGRSQDGAAEVRLGHTGALLDLRLDRGLAGASLERIRSALLEANATAQAELAGRVTELTARALGQDSGTTREIAAHYREMFPASHDVAPGPGLAGVLR